MAEKLNFTKNSLLSLPVPRNGRSYYLDTKLRGLGLCITDRDTRSFYLMKTIRGSTRRVSIPNGRFPDMTIEQARRKAVALMSDIAEGINPIEQRREQKASAITLREVLQSYINDRELKPLTIKDYHRAIDETWHKRMDQPMGRITEEMVQRRYRERGKESKARADNAMRVLNALFRYARAKYKNAEGNSLFPVNPVQILNDTRSRYKPKRKQSYITASDLPEWFEAVAALDNTTARDYLLFLLFTGTRREEAAQLRWQQINFKERAYTLLDTKNREDVTLPLSDYLIQMLDGRPRDSEYVFSAEGDLGYFTSPKRPIAAVRKQSGTYFSLHDLRRTFLTIAESLDISSYTLKRLVNHKTGANDVTGGYIVSDPERLRKASQQITDRILRLAKQGKKADVIKLHA